MNRKLTWKATGNKAKLTREKCGITRNDLAKLMKCSREKVIRFEMGLPIEAAKLTEACYYLALEKLALEKEIDFEMIKMAVQFEMNSTVKNIEIKTIHDDVDDYFEVYIVHSNGERELDDTYFFYDLAQEQAIQLAKIYSVDVVEENA